MKSSIVASWIVALSVAFWFVPDTPSATGWIGLALVGLMPPVMLTILARQPVQKPVIIVRSSRTGVR